MKTICVKIFKNSLWAVCLLAVFAGTLAACTEDEPEDEVMQYLVTFDPEGGSTVPSQTVEEGGLVAEPAIPVRSGYAFTGWYLESACQTLWDFDTDVVTSALTLYAGWEKADIDALRDLLDSVGELNPSAYEEVSFAVVKEKFEAALALVMAPESASPDDILHTYQELKAAVNQLVELPYRAATDFRITPVPQEDGTINIAPGAWCNLSAYGIAEDGKDATYNAVKFEYDESYFAAMWQEEGYQTFIEANTISFFIKADAEPGSTMDVTIHSEDPHAGLSRTVTLKVATTEEMEAQYIDLVNSLPSPDAITFDNYDAIAETLEQLQLLSQSLPYPGSAEMQEAQRKLETFYYAFDEFFKFDYKFDGDRCILNEEGDLMYADYEANGSFPCGTYTIDEWEEWDYEAGQSTYAQFRLVLKSDGTLDSQFRTSASPSGSNPSAWQTEATGTYSVTGTQAEGGSIYMKVVYEDEEDPLPPIDNKLRLMRKR